MTLDQIALSLGTDKSSKLHNYTEKYDFYFSKMRDEKLKVLEIGIQNGFSLKMWKQYFQNSEIFGIDTADCSSFQEERVIPILGSQNDLSFLESVLIFNFVYNIENELVSIFKNSSSKLEKSNMIDPQLKNLEMRT